MPVNGFHKNCYACGKRAKDGLKLKFRLLTNGTIHGKFSLAKKYQGYDNILHGGSSVLF